MALSFDAFLYGMRAIESGGNYKAVGPVTKSGDRAYGKYQIMGGNIVRWGKQYLGRNITIQQYRNSEQLQDELSEAVLRSYYDKYGAAGAAAMWFSGEANPNSSASDGYLTVKQYVAKMNKEAAKYTGGSSGSSYQPWESGGGKTPSIDPTVLAEQYGLVKQLIDSVPELKTLFNKAVKEGWVAEKFQASLKNTKWWKSTSETQRQYLIKSITDPATHRRDWNTQFYRINELGNSLGLFNVGGNKQLIDHLVYNVMYNGWSDAQLKYEMANFLMLSPEGGLAGAGGQFQSKMSQMAWANGVKLDSNWYLNNYRNIMKGVVTEEQTMRDIRNQAAAMFPAFREQIMAGQNVMDIASPYITGMSNILELNQGDLDLFDPMIKGALNYKDPKSGATGAKPLWQWEVDLRKDPRWNSTNNAREGLMAVGHKVAQDMGVLF